jgi:hypothetical protein
MEEAEKKRRERFVSVECGKLRGFFVRIKMKKKTEKKKKMMSPK